MFFKKKKQIEERMLRVDLQKIIQEQRDAFVSPEEIRPHCKFILKRFKNLQEELEQSANDGYHGRRVQLKSAPLRTFARKHPEYFTTLLLACAETRTDIIPKVESMWDTTINVIFYWGDGDDQPKQATQVEDNNSDLN